MIATFCLFPKLSVATRIHKFFDLKCFSRFLTMGSKAFLSFDRKLAKIAEQESSELIANFDSGS